MNEPVTFAVDLNGGPADPRTVETTVFGGREATTPALVPPDVLHLDGITYNRRAGTTATYDAVTAAP